MREGIVNHLVILGDSVLARLSIMRLFIPIAFLSWRAIMGIDKVKLIASYNSIEILNENYFKQFYYTKFTDENNIFLSKGYLESLENLPLKNSDILNIVLRPRDNAIEFEFSSKDILSRESYPNRGMDEINIDTVLTDLNQRADGVYRIKKEKFLDAEIASAEVFYDFPKDSFLFDSHQIINSLAYASMKHKEKRLFGGETLTLYRKGFSIKFYDKDKECFKKHLGKKFKELNLNPKNTIRVEVSGKSDSRSTGLDKKYFHNKKLKTFLSLEYQYSLILDYVNELTFHGRRL